MSKLPSSLTNVTSREGLLQHPAFERYVVDKINIHYASSKRPPHWQSNWIFQTAGGSDPGVVSLKLNPTMELRGAEDDTRSMFEVSLVSGVGPVDGHTANKLISLKTPMPVADLFDELEINGLFDYEPVVESKGSLWWHYGLISWLEQKGYSVAGSTSDFLQWLAVLSAEIKAVSGGNGQCTPEVDLVLSARGNFTRGERYDVHLLLVYGSSD